MIRCFFTALLCGSFLMVAFSSCKNTSTKTPEVLRFEQLLSKAHINNDDSVSYIVWNNMSCAGCRSYTAQLLEKGTGNNHVKMIVPLSYVNDIHSVNPEQVIVDSLGSFSKLYFGIDNIGIIKVYNNEVLSIKNYNANEMENLKSDLGK